VRPARKPTRASGLPARVFSSVDLPVLPPPQIATSSTGTSKSMAGSTVRRRRPSQSWVGASGPSVVIAARPGRTSRSTRKASRKP